MRIDIKSRLEVARRIWAHRWVKSAVTVWGFVCTYDTLLSQIIPESLGSRFPKVRDAIAMSSGFLPFWGWLLVLAAILVAASLEYAFRKVGPVAISNASARIGVVDWCKNVLWAKAKSYWWAWLCVGVFSGVVVSRGIIAPGDSPSTPRTQKPEVSLLELKSVPAPRTLPSVAAPQAHNGTSEIAHARLLYDGLKKELNIISSDPRISNITINEPRLYNNSGPFNTYNVQYWVVRFLFPPGTGKVSTKISGDAQAESGVIEESDNYVSAFVRFNPYGGLNTITPGLQSASPSGELDFEFSK